MLGEAGNQNDLDSFRILECRQKNLSEVLPQLGQLSFIRSIPVHAAVLCEEARQCKKNA